MNLLSCCQNLIGLTLLHPPHQHDHRQNSRAKSVTANTNCKPKHRVTFRYLTSSDCNMNTKININFQTLINTGFWKEKIGNLHISLLGCCLVWIIDYIFKYSKIHLQSLLWDCVFRTNYLNENRRVLLFYRNLYFVWLNESIEHGIMWHKLWL